MKGKETCVHTCPSLLSLPLSKELVATLVDECLLWSPLLLLPPFAFLMGNVKQDGRAANGRGRLAHSDATMGHRSQPPIPRDLCSRRKKRGRCGRWNVEVLRVAYLSRMEGERKVSNFVLTTSTQSPFLSPLFSSPPPPVWH